MCGVAIFRLPKANAGFSNRADSHSDGLADSTEGCFSCCIVVQARRASGNTVFPDVLVQLLESHSRCANGCFGSCIVALLILATLRVIRACLRLSLLSSSMCTGT